MSEFELAEMTPEQLLAFELKQVRHDLEHVTGERTAAEQEMKRLKAQLKERQKDYSKTLKEAVAEVERLTSELAEAKGRECTALCRDVEEDRDSMLVEVELFRPVVEAAFAAVGEIRDMRVLSHAARLLIAAADEYAAVTGTPLDVLVEERTARAEASAVIGRVVEALDKRVLDAAEGVADEFRDLPILSPAEEAFIAAVDARRALVEVEDTPKPQDRGNVDKMMRRYLTSARDFEKAGFDASEDRDKFPLWERAALAGMCAYALNALDEVNSGAAEAAAAYLADADVDGILLSLWVGTQLAVLPAVDRDGEVADA